MAHNPFPFRHDAHPDLTKAIRGVVSESHTKSQLEKMSITRLRELKKKYEGLVVKGDKDASRELADIRGLLRSKGAGVVVDEGVSPCEAAAAKRLKAADAEDLKEKPGAAGKAAHKRLHKTIKSVVGEGVIRDTVQRVKNKLRGDGFRTDRDIEAERAEDRRADKEQLDAERRERAWRAEQRKKGLGKKKKLPKNVWVDRVDAGELPSKFREWDRRQKERLDSIGR